MKIVTALLNILAICGALAAAVFFLLSEERNTAGEAQAEQLETRLQASLSAQRTQSQSLTELQAKLETLETERQQTLSQLTLEQAKAHQFSRELGDFEQSAQRHRLDIEELRKENARLKAELAQEQANSISRGEVLDFEAKIKQLEAEILALRETRPGASGPMTADSPRLEIPKAPRLRGEVLTIGKQNSFVVINLGYRDGVRLDNAFVIHKDGACVAQITVSEVKENLSIARILPHSLLDAPQVGDAVSSLN